MEQLKKGSHAPRERVTCEQCGSEFERSAVHPYIVKCPTCRGVARAATQEERTVHKKVRCPLCREMIKRDGGLRMHVCPRCKDQWWSLPGGWWRDWITDDVFLAGKLMGSLRESSFKELVARSSCHA